MLREIHEVVGIVRIQQLQRWSPSNIGQIGVLLLASGRALWRERRQFARRHVVAVAPGHREHGHIVGCVLHAGLCGEALGAGHGHHRREGRHRCHEHHPQADRPAALVAAVCGGPGPVAGAAPDPGPGPAVVHRHGRRLHRVASIGPTLVSETVLYWFSGRVQSISSMLSRVTATGSITTWPVSWVPPSRKSPQAAPARRACSAMPCTIAVTTTLSRM